MSVSAQPRMAETDKPCRGRNSAAEASDGHGRQEQERVTDAARREDPFWREACVGTDRGPGEGQRQMAQPPLFSSRQGEAIFIQVDETRRVGRTWGDSCSTIMLGSDPALRHRTFWRIVSVTGRPGEHLDDALHLHVHFPAGSERGPLIDRHAVRIAGDRFLLGFGPRCGEGVRRADAGASGIEKVLKQRQSAQPRLGLQPVVSPQRPLGPPALPSPRSIDSHKAIRFDTNKSLSYI